MRGREPGLRLRTARDCIALRDWGQAIVTGLIPIAEYLDQGLAEPRYAAAAARAEASLRDPDLTPSARVLAEIRANDSGFMAWALERARQHTTALQTLPLAAEAEEQYRKSARESLRRQEALEAESVEPFETYLARYYAGI